MSEYEETLEQMKADDIPRHQIVSYMEQNNESVLDLENLPRQRHKWIDRGLKFSCEGAGHANHQSWKYKPSR